MVETVIFWTGICNVKNICFQQTNKLEYTELSIQKQIDKLWLDHQKNYPDDYDGQLLFLRHFEHEESLDSSESFLFLNVSFMSYSTHIGLNKLKIPVKKFGVLGNQIAIFDESEKYILVGKRKTNQLYAPGLLTLPGGMFESNDLIKQNFLRELYEEVDISIKDPKIIALLSDHTNRSSIFLVKAVLNQKFDPNQIFPDKEHEFENGLFWLPISELQAINSYNLMEGLTYFQSINSYH